MNTSSSATTVNTPNPEQLLVPVANAHPEEAPVALPCPSLNGTNVPRTRQPDQPFPNGRNDRDGRGRFLPGNPGGPGNPFARRIAALRRTFCKTVTEKDMQALARQLLVRAQGGDLAAAELLFAYALGRPVDVVDPDTLDLKEWQQHQQAVPAKAVSDSLERLPPGMACLLVRTIGPYLAGTLAQQLLEQFDLQASEPGATAHPE